MALHSHQVELCMLESVILLSYAVPPVKDEGTYCLYKHKSFAAPCQIVHSDFGWALVGHFWGFMLFFHMTMSLILLKKSLRFPCYELEIVFVTGMHWSQHHSNVSVMQVFEDKKQFLLFPHMDFMLAWSHLQINTLYVRSLLSHGFIAVAKQQGFPCKFKSSFREETAFCCLGSHLQDFTKRNLDLLHWPPFSSAWMRPADVGMNFFSGFYNEYCAGEKNPAG